MLELFEHNQNAYDAAMAMLSETGKAAVIHPTGTGKSYIAFKLCVEHPDSLVCWLSPSRYIFDVQIENLQSTSGITPENIRFFTYAKLAQMDQEELSELKPDYLILDEFHRCGAEVWGEGVQDLLDLYPDVPVLGLSATHIRYLDNQRDMADELFDGNIASEMSLGEAIVRGILNPPKYVLSVFSYQKDLERYEKRVRSARNKAVQQAADEYLEALRRALEKADGLDVIFHKHMTDRSGKYIVFCSNVDHLHEMMELAPKWFSNVDENAHYYCAYSDNPATDADFARFKEDSSNHLKLLFCVDMLNEGIHVEDVSGVILLRPTVSPIIYKQQIGRALSASKKKDAVIFDIVLNIENLYSIGAIEEEMQIATTYYREHGLADEIVNDQFHVIDEVRDCIDLFNGLNETLSASWDLMYAAAEQYYQTFGDLEVPTRYMTKDGFSLGMWVRTQRRVYDGKCSGILTAGQIEKLNQIGMRWDSARDLAWDNKYSIAKEYYEEFGALPTSVTDRFYHGIQLERWLAKLRGYRKSGIQKEYLTLERIAALDELGMVWDIPDFIWEQNYHAAIMYYKEHQNLKVPRDYVSEDGVKLGLWVANTRRIIIDGNKGNTISPEQIQLLKELGLSLQKRKTISWADAYDYACKYREKNGNLYIPISYVTSDGYGLGSWIRRQRDQFNKHRLSIERTKLLDKLGMVWELPDPWEEKFLLVKAYYEENGDAMIPATYKVDGIWLGRWLSTQVKYLNENKAAQKLSPEQKKKLESVGLRPNQSQYDMAWEQRYESAVTYYKEHGNIRLSRGYCTDTGEKLGSWLQAQRNSYNKGILSQEHIDKLEQIGMIWDPAWDDWQFNYGRVRSHYEQHGNLDLPRELKSRTGGSLSVWLDNQRIAYRDGKLSEKQISMLETVKMDWRPLTEIAWEMHYAEAKEYFEKHGNLNMTNSYKCANGFVLGRWIKRQREHADELSTEKKARLDEIQMIWE